MPLITYPRKALDMYIELTRAQQQAEKEYGCGSREWGKCFDKCCGFMDALKCFLDSTQRGCIIMEGDSIIETGEGCLPKLVLDFGDKQ